MSSLHFKSRTAQSSQSAACPASLTPTVSYNTKNQITGGFIQYDPSGSGNVIADATTGNQYLYDGVPVDRSSLTGQDGEGRICAVKSEPVASTYTLTGYIYDADGTRVSKGSLTQFTCDLNPADSTYNGFRPTSDYILGPGGEQVTEMAMDANNTMAWQHTNVYAAGALIATYDNTGLHFYFNDPLGTRRAQTDYAGVLEQTCASLPFGDGLTCTGSITAPTEHHFTGKERDTESGNDNFGARYYAGSMGRFMSPDWDSEPNTVPYADFDDPQSLNLYSYAGNSPLISMDSNGHYHCDGKDSWDPVTNTLTAAGCHFDWYDSRNLFQTAQIAVKSATDLASQAAHQFANILNTPGGAKCLAGTTMGGAMVGGTVGGEVGLVGLAGGGVAVVVTEPVGLAVGTIGGGGTGFIAGMTMCPGGAASGGGGGGGGGGGNSTSQAKKLTPGEIAKLKEKGIDPELLKEEIGVTRSSKSDLYKMPNGDIIVKGKGGVGSGEPTGININHL